MYSLHSLNAHDDSKHQLITMYSYSYYNYYYILNKVKESGTVGENVNLRLSVSVTVNGKKETGTKETRKEQFWKRKKVTGQKETERKKQFYSQQFHTFNSSNLTITELPLTHCS